MSPELDEQLVKNYPELYKNRYGSEFTTALCWGFEVGDGWYKIIDDLSKRLSSGPDPIPTVFQVKEKFGSLRFYVDSATDIQYKMIDDAEKQSKTTCEVCGNPGEIGGKRWLKCRCKDHAN
jgi:hypothetical protein